MYIKNLGLSVAVTMFSATCGYAVTLPDVGRPDAGSILREQQPQRQLLPDQLPKPETEKAQAPIDENALRVQVRGFKFKGNEGVITEAELKALVADSIGKSVSMGDLQALIEKITSRLKNNGWFLSRAYLPKQDITSGIVLIQIEQGKSDGRIQFSRDKDARIRLSVLRSYGEQSVTPGQPLNEQQLERSVLIMNDIPGVNAKASLSPGLSSGTSKVDVAVTEGPLVSGTVSGDNQGNRYTGTWRANAMVAVNDITGYGDKLTVMGTESVRLKQGKVTYGFPVFYDGLRGTVSYTAMDYQLGELDISGFEGNSQGVEAGLNYPIIRSRIGSVISSLNYGYRELEDLLNGVTYRAKHSRYLSLGMTGDRYDTLLGSGYFSWSAGMTAGNLEPVVNLTPIALNSGQYTRFNFSMSRLQRISERSMLSLSWAAQIAAQNLDSSERYSLGGPYGIRAYPVGEASGDQAQLINIDLRYNIPLEALKGNLQLSGFFDAGQVQIEKNRVTANFGTASNLNSYWLQGAGLGLSYDLSGRFMIKGIWAHVIGDNPGRTASVGANSDGKSDRSRYWLQALMYF
ncbi:MAG: ShlB/FhaC/HecB family hemolysin secretion/activation protein [Chlorobiaceae bacterium]|nr:ShlB/FhaC/HecB family hemolysin secretion/activation protein [Chlorobiaceae bacterium]